MVGLGLIAAAVGLVFAAAPVAGAGTARAVPPGAVTRTAAHGAQPAASPAALPAGSQVIFSNFGPPGNAYESSIGWTVSAAGSAVGSFLANANAFTPAVNSQITRIDIALSHFLGTNNATIQLAPDNGGVPGTPIRSWLVAGQPAFGTCCAVTTIDVSPLVPVAAGKRYWLIAKPGPNALNDTWDAWNWTYNGAQTGPVLTSDGTNWFVPGAVSGAFDIVACGKLCKVYP
jgi:hypothetical protein